MSLLTQKEQAILLLALKRCIYAKDVLTKEDREAAEIIEKVGTRLKVLKDFPAWLETSNFACKDAYAYQTNAKPKGVES